MAEKRQTRPRRRASMAEKQLIRTRVPYGHLGSLVYLPHEGDEGGVGTFETSRKLFDPPEFRVTRPFEVVKPVSRAAPVENEDYVTYEEKRVQERWLKNTLPEAFLGNTVFPDLLTEGQDQPEPQTPIKSKSKARAAAGEISDWRDPWRVTGAASLAMATGEGSQILRLLRLYESPWLWDDQEDVSLGTWDLRPGDREEEAYWCRDAAPITRIKYFTHLALGVPFRWLIVQKESSTTILSPVYHPVPVSYSNAALEDRPASRVDPNEVLSFTLEHTEGRSHVDVDINPARRDAPLQVAIIDDHGGWSIWNVSGELSSVASPTLRPTLYRRGTFWEDIPDEQRRGFGLLWYHPPPDDFGYDPRGDEDPENIAALPGVTSVLAGRSHTLMMWNHSTIQVLDTDAGSVCAYVAITQRTEKKEAILQIQSNPADPSQALVLTTHSVICLDICPLGEYERASPHVLHAYHHDHPRNTTLELSASTSAVDGNAAFVLVYTKDSPRASIFWFYGATGNSIERYSYQLQYFRRDGPENTDAHSLCVLPMKLSTYKKKAPRGTGSMYRRLDLEFQQIVSVGTRQSLGFWLCATAKRRTGKILSPEPWRPTEWGRGVERSPQEAEQIKRRLAYVHHMTEKLVVPDPLEDINALVTTQWGEEGKDENSWLEFEPLPSVKREILIKRRFYPHVVLEAYRDTLSEGRTLRNESLEAVRLMLGAGLRAEGVPRRSLLECAGMGDSHDGLNGIPTIVDGEEWARELTEAVDEGMGTLSLKTVDINSPWRTDDFAENLRAMREKLTELWPIPPEHMYPEAAAQRRAILEETALLAVLAYHTIEVKDPSLPSQPLPPLSQSSTLPFSSQLSADSDSQPPSSHPSSSQPPSKPQSKSSQKAARRAAEAEASRATLARLSNLATNLNSGATLAGLTQHPVLGRWDEAGLEDYTAFIEQPAAAQQDKLRRRKQRQAERRRAKEEAFKRLTGREAASSPPRGGSQGLEETRDRAESGGAGAGAGGLSQGTSIPLRVGNRAGELMSSQSQVTMSQPVGGAFGGRPMKRRKKKGGIK